MLMVIIDYYEIAKGKFRVTVKPEQIELEAPGKEIRRRI